MVDFRLSRGAVLTSVAATLGQPASAHARLDETLTAFNRLNFPAGLPKGRGHRAGYEITQYWQTVFAFHIANFGLSVPAAAAQAKNSWDLAYSGINSALGGSQCIAGYDYFWMGVPARQGDFWGEPATLEQDTKNGTVESQIVTIALDRHEPTDTLDEAARQFGLVSAWFVDVRLVVERAVQALSAPELGINQLELEQALRSWCE